MINPVQQLRAKAAEMLRLADQVEQALGGSPAPTAPQPKVKGGHSMSMRDAISQALIAGPLTPRELTAAVLKLRPSTPADEVHKACYWEKKEQRILKGDDGRWRLAGQADAIDLPPVEVDARGVREVIRDIVAKHTVNAIDLTDDVVAILPHVSRQKISTAISQMVSEGRLRKNEDLTLRLMDGTSGNGKAAHA